MRNTPTPGIAGNGHVDVTSFIQTGLEAISSEVRKKYSLIQPESIPNHVNYSKVEKYLRSVNIEVTRRMFISYLKDQLLPNDHDVKNRHFSLYTHEQIIYYILIDMFKPFLPLGKVKVLLKVVLKPMIDALGINATYLQLCQNIIFMLDCFESAVLPVVRKNAEMILSPKSFPIDSQDIDGTTIPGRVAYCTHIATLCMARGALDCYKQTPNNLIP